MLELEPSHWNGEAVCLTCIEIAGNGEGQVFDWVNGVSQLQLQERFSNKGVVNALGISPFIENGCYWMAYVTLQGNHS